MESFHFDIEKTQCTNLLHEFMTAVVSTSAVDSDPKHCGPVYDITDSGESVAVGTVTRHR